MIEAGGVPIAQDRSTLRFACHVVVGTPGRLLSLLREGILPPKSALKLLVLDEVDQLMGVSSIVPSGINGDGSGPVSEASLQQIQDISSLSKIDGEFVFPSFMCTHFAKST